MFIFLHTFAFGHISGEGGKGSRAPKSWSQPVGGQLPSRQHLSLVFGLLVNSQQRLCSPFIWICCLLVKNCDRALVQFDLTQVLESCFSEYYWGRRWQLEYKSEYLLFSSYRQAAWSERMTSRLSILFICCHFLRWKALLCQIPIDRLVCNALEWQWRSVLVERRHFANWPSKQATSCHILGCLFLPPVLA